MTRSLNYTNFRTKIGCGFKKLGWQRKSDRGDIRYANKSMRYREQLEDIADSLLCHGGWRTSKTSRPSLFLSTHFRSMLNRVFNFELSSALSETYASGLEVVVVSAVEAMEVAGDGAGDALVLFEGGSLEAGEVILKSWRVKPVCREGRGSRCCSTLCYRREGHQYPPIISFHTDDD